MDSSPVVSKVGLEGGPFVFVGSVDKKLHAVTTAKGEAHRLMEELLQVDPEMTLRWSPLLQGDEYWLEGGLVISQGACAPETGHLADSMPEVEHSHDLVWILEGLSKILWGF